MWIVKIENDFEKCLLGFNGGGGGGGQAREF